MTDVADTLEAETAFAAALATVQSNMPQVGKDKSASIRSDKGSYTYRYADLASILDAVSPVAAAQGFSFMATPTLSAGGAFVLRYCLLHKGGHREGGEYPLPDPTRSTPQQVGSHITYARRYVYCAMLGVAADEDDDGRAGAQTTSRPRQAPRPVVDGSAGSLQVPPTTAAPDAVDETTGELSSGVPTTAPDAWPHSSRPVTMPGEAITDRQKRMVMALLNGQGLKEHDVRMAWLAGVVGREVSSTSELTVTEASTAIDALKEGKA